MAGPESSTTGSQAVPLEEEGRPAAKANEREPTARDFMLATALPDQYFQRSASGQAPADKRSYLDYAVHAALDPASSLVSGREQASQEAAGYMKGFLKVLPLFMKGRTALPALAIAYMSDEAKVQDSAYEQTLDAGLGLSKGLILKGSLKGLSARGATPGTTGVSLGIVGRSSDTALTRSNYYDAEGNFRPELALKKTASITFNPAALAMDAATYSAADVMWAKMFNASRGSVFYRPTVTSTLAAGSMGLTSGFGHEIHRQMSSDSPFDPYLLARRTLMQGVVDGLAGGLGGLQATRQMRLKLTVKDGPNSLTAARNTPFQLGEIVDARQAQLRDGTFIPERQVKGLTTETWLGTVKTRTGENIPAVFRPNNGTEAFAHRMQSEIAAYGMTRLGFKTQLPATVARKVELNGKAQSGFIQEIQGTSLPQFIKEALPNGKGYVTAREAKALLNSDAGFKQSYTDAWVHRLIMGEWDNHALNMAVRKAGQKTDVRNIDLGDGLKPATTQLDLTPQPGVRRGYDMVNAHLYSQLSGRRLTPQKIEELSTLHQRFTTRSGREQLQELGMTPQQVEGVLGRTEWLLRNKHLPRQQESTFYLYLGNAKRAVKRWLER